jgi:hypothetical protein
MYDSYVGHSTSDIQVTIPENGDYTWILSSDGKPSGHAPKYIASTEKCFSLWLYNDTAHYLWSNFGTGEDGKHYGLMSGLPAGTYTIRTNLYANDNINYTLKFWNIKLIKGNYVPWDSWSPYSDDLMEYDCSGYGNHGTAFVSLETGTDSPRYSYSTIFPGNTASRITNTTTQFYYQDNFSWSCWIKHKYPNSTSFAFTVGRADYSPDWGYGLEEVSASSMRIRFGSSSYIISLDEGNWHHLAFTKSGDIITIYIDGVPTNHKFTGTSPAYTNSQGLGIGCFWYSGGALYPFYGRLSDFRLYATALSAAAVKELY